MNVKDLILLVFAMYLANKVYQAEECFEIETKDLQIQDLQKQIKNLKEKNEL